MTKAELLHELQNDPAFRVSFANSLLAGVELLHWTHDPHHPISATNPPKGSIIVCLFGVHTSIKQTDYIATDPIAFGAKR